MFQYGTKQKYSSIAFDIIRILVRGWFGILLSFGSKIKI